MIELVSKAGGGNLQARDRSRCSPPPLLQTYFPMANLMDRAPSTRSNVPTARAA